MCKLSQSNAQHVIHVQGHKVKYSNCNNSAADCPISLKVRTEFDCDEDGLLYTCSLSKVKARGQSSRSQRNLMYKRLKRPKMATDRLSEFKLARATTLKQTGTALRRAASSCNAFAIATFSSLLSYANSVDDVTSADSSDNIGRTMSVSSRSGHCQEVFPSHYPPP